MANTAWQTAYAPCKHTLCLKVHLPKEHTIINFSIWKHRQVNQSIPQSQVLNQAKLSIIVLGYLVANLTLTYRYTVCYIFGNLAYYGSSRLLELEHNVRVFCRLNFQPLFGWTCLAIKSHFNLLHFLILQLHAGDWSKPKKAENQSHIRHRKQ